MPTMCQAVCYPLLRQTMSGFKFHLRIWCLCCHISKVEIIIKAILCIYKKIFIKALRTPLGTYQAPNK